MKSCHARPNSSDAVVSRVSCNGRRRNKTTANSPRPNELKGTFRHARSALFAALSVCSRNEE